MKFNIQKYFEISTIHGLFYISKRNHLVERIFWIIALIFSVICTSILIVELIIKIRIFPIVVYVADDSISISEIHFPAMTICPRFSPFFDWAYLSGRPLNYRYEKHTIQKYFFEEEEFNAETADEIKLGNFSKLELLEELKAGNLKPDEMGIKLLKRLQVIDILTNGDIFYNLNYSVPTDNFFEILNEFSKEFDEDTITVNFYWINQLKPYFSEVLTPYGLCYSFNIAFSHDILNINATSEDFHYHHVQPMLYTKIDDKSFRYEPLDIDMPRKTSNVKAGLNFGVTSYKGPGSGLVDSVFNGYLCFFHDGFELPTWNSDSRVIGLSRNIHVLIHPQMNDVDESIAEYDAVDRNCYLKDEKVLKFFKTYTKNNCEAECLTAFMLSHCGCVEFYMIRSPSTRICSAIEKNCYEKAHADFSKEKGTCKCLDPCSNIKYDFEVVELEFVRNRNPEISAKLTASMMFKSQFFMQFVSKQQFNTLDFMSFVGGILGLFAGFSALSFIELIYWFTVRVLIGNAKKLSARVHPIDENMQDEGVVRKSWKYLKSFFDESSIHGLKYIFEFTKIDSIIWAFFLIATLTFCFDLMSGAPEKVPDSRIVAFDDSVAFKDKVPFPAFTIVPSYIMRRMTFDVWELFLTRKNLDIFRHNKTAFDFFMKKATKNLFCQNEYDSSIYGFKDSILPYIIDVVKEDSKVDWFRDQYTSFNGKYKPEFAEIRTTRGMGFTFGLIKAEELINFEHVSSLFNYTRNITTQPKNLQKFPEEFKIPLKINRQIKPVLTLKFVENTPKTMRNCIEASFLIHQPDYLPTFVMREEFYSFEPGMTINIEIVPEVTRTDENLKSLSPETRECYFEDEKSLKYFKKYSKKNCEFECLAELTYKHDGCFDIDQPFKDESQICKKIRKFMNNYAPHNILNDLYAAGNFTFEANCSCLPMCNSVTYNIKYFAEFDEEQEGGNETTINVIMNMDEIVLFRRFQQFTFSDVVSYVGGLLGLFAGISMLSIIEFFYFFTIRVGVDIGRMLKRRF